MNKPQKNTNEATKKNQVAVQGQYIKDFSFENPNAPTSFAQKNTSPKLDVTIDIQVKKLKEAVYEVTLLITSKAVVEDAPIFMIELAYAGVFAIQSSDQEREPLLMIYCPNLLFPYARRILSDITRDAGFPPLMLDPIDFVALFKQHKKNTESKKDTV